MKRERILRFILLTEVDDWLALGWLVIDTLPGSRRGCRWRFPLPSGPHAYWSVLGEWLCNCPTPKLKRRGT